MMVVFVNPLAGGGRALGRWNEMAGEVGHRYGAVEVHVLGPQNAVEPLVDAALSQGQRRFVAAGGDGTVQQVLQALLDAAHPGIRSQLRLGAIGLGSSNDFHKPFRDEQRIMGVPCKLDFENAAPRDVGVLTSETRSGEQIRRYWIVNCSIGVTAEANDFFNGGDLLLARLKPRAPFLAIVYAALHTLLTYRSRRVELEWNARRESQLLTNLAVVKSPYCSGVFRYDSDFRPRNRMMEIHAYTAPNRAHSLYLLAQLARGRFSGCAGTRSVSARRLTASADRSFAIEFDGEVLRARRVTFFLTEPIHVCP